jgi:tetratricopeptide (TPR) repeat protein
MRYSYFPLKSFILFLITTPSGNCFHIVVTPKRQRRNNVVTVTTIRNDRFGSNCCGCGSSGDGRFHHYHCCGLYSSIFDIHSSTPTTLYSSSSSNGARTNDKHPITAAEQERRNEDKRRQERIHDVVPGTTSAIIGAKDYAINIHNTQTQFLRQASLIEQEIYTSTERGMDMIRALRLDDAATAFDRVLQLKPDAYLWQAGIVQFYLGDLQRAIDIFTRCATIYETRFDEIASEERIWRNASVLKKLSNMSRKERKVLSDKSDVESIDMTCTNFDSTDKVERRKVVRLTLELFQSSVYGDLASTVVATAKLRAIGGSLNDLIPAMDKKLWRISSWYYLGLHYDVLGDVAASKMCMKAALQLCPNANSDDLMHILPMLHMSCREWFDDEDFDAGRIEEQTESIIDESNDNGDVSEGREGVDPIVRESLRSSLEKTRIVDLQEALRKRGLRSTGSKLVLQQRLYDSLVDDFLSC